MILCISVVLVVMSSFSLKISVNLDFLTFSHFFSSVVFLSFRTFFFFFFGQSIFPVLFSCLYECSCSSVNFSKRIILGSLSNSSEISISFGSVVGALLVSLGGILHA